MFCTEKNTNQRWSRWSSLGLPDHLWWSSLWQYIVKNHFVLIKQLHLKWWMYCRAGSVCYATIFSFHYKIGSMGEDKDPEDSSISHTGTFFSRCEEYNLLLLLLRNGCACSLIDPSVLWRFCKVLFESIPLFRIN